MTLCDYPRPGGSMPEVAAWDFPRSKRDPSFVGAGLSGLLGRHPLRCVHLLSGKCNIGTGTTASRIWTDSCDSPGSKHRSS